MKGCQGKSGEREPNGRNEAEGVLQEGAEDDDQCVAKGGAKDDASHLWRGILRFCVATGS